MEVQEGKTYLTVPHEGGKLTFQYSPFRGTYGNVANEIDKAELKRPNSAETASLVYDAWKNPEERYSSEIIKILRDRWFWEFTGNLYLPKSNGPRGVSSGEEINNGVILETNPKILNEELVMNKNSLVQRLKDNDSSVKFVPFGYKIGEQTPRELEKNEYIIARYGKEGAEKISEIASIYKNPPFLYSFNYVNEEKIKMSALGSGWYFGDRLYVDGGFLDPRKVGHALGIKKE